uniref:Corrinoid adenosyltransferase n=1 Tax=Heterorhabditis bacteriophora TaxID=37862 RepID=A0A1I7X945_HETBA
MNFFYLVHLYAERGQLVLTLLILLMFWLDFNAVSRTSVHISLHLLIQLKRKKVCIHRIIFIGYISYCLALTSFDPEMVEWINGEIDRFGDQLPPIRQFILAGGCEPSASLQYARAVCRKTERSVVPLLRQEQLDPMALKFLNRMSDLLFVLGRFSCMKTDSEELTYIRPTSFTAQKWQRKKIQ